MIMPPKVLVTLVIAAISFFLLAAVGSRWVFDFVETARLSWSVFSIDLALNDLIIRIGLVGAGVAALILAYFLDYSGAFPKNLSMTVSFDEAGIEKRIRLLPKRISKDFPLHPDRLARRTAFFECIDSKLREANPTQTLKRSETVALTGKGYTHYLVQMVSARQKYQFVKADGLVLLKGGNLTDGLETKFKLRDTEQSFFCPSFSDLAVRGTFFVNPEVTQTYRLNPTLEKEFDDLTVLTKVRFFPYIEIGDSLYLLKQESMFVPIGFCIYSVS